MNRRAIRLLNLRGLRSRPGRTALAIVAVGAGVALVVGVVIAYASFEHSLRSFSEAIAGPAELRVEGPVDHGGLDESVLPKVGAVRGVRSAVPLVLSITRAGDRRGHTELIPVLGVDCSVEAVTGSFGCSPDLLRALRGGPAIGPALRERLGAGGTLQTDLGVRSLRDAPVVTALREVNGGRVAIFDLATAQRELDRPHGLDAILVVPEAGADLHALRDRVQGAVGAHNRVGLRPSDPIGGSLVAALVLPFMFLISLVGLLIGGQLVRNTIELSLEERRRELATASALGARPRDVLSGVLAEATAIGLAGGLVGLGLGLGVAHAFVASLSDQLARATGLHVSVVITPLALAVGVVVGIGVCLATSIGPARRAARRELTTELSERGRYEPQPTVRQVRTVLVLVSVGVAVVLSWVAHRDAALERWQPPLLYVALVLALLTGFQVPGVLVTSILRLARGRPRLATGPGRVAIDNLLSMPKRTAAVASAIAAPMIMAVVLSSVVPGIGAGAQRLAHQGSAGRVYVSTLPTNNGSMMDAKTPPDVERRLAALPHVAQVEHAYYATLQHPTIGEVELDGIDGAIPDYDVHRGMSGPEAIAAGRVMIGPRLARDLRLDPGDHLRVPGRYGFVDLTVGGIWASPAGIGRGITTTAEVMRTITGERPSDRLQAVPTAGTTPEELADEIRAAHLDDRLLVLDPEELAVDYRREFTEIASPFWAMQRALLVVALVATASTLLLAGLQRRRETATLAALGMSPADLGRTTLVETLLLGGVTTILGAAAAQALLVCFTWTSQVTTGLVIPYRPQMGGFVLASLTATGVALVGAALPAWRTSRIDPALALREA